MTSFSDLTLQNSILATGAYLSTLDKRIASLLPVGGAFVDLGCGEGKVLDDVWPLYAEAMGFDFYSTRLDARKGAPINWQYVVADLNAEIALPRASVDAVYSNQVVEHLLDPFAFSGEIYRILRPGGRAVLTTPNIRYLRHIFRLAVLGRGPRTANDDNTDGVWDDGHLHYFTHRDLRDVFHAQGFSLVHSQAFVNIHRPPHWLRGVFDRFAHFYPVREWLSGNMLFLLER